MKYGYSRVYPKGQAKFGNSLEEQVKKLQAGGCEVIHKETFTGTKNDRPLFT